MEQGFSTSAWEKAAILRWPFKLIPADDGSPEKSAKEDYFPHLAPHPPITLIMVKRTIEIPSATHD